MRILRGVWWFCALIGCTAVFHGCSMVTITSEPPGAEITYSPTGSPPWKPWPPNRSEPKTTPAHEVTNPEPYYYVRVHKTGCYPVQPLFVDAGLMRRQHLHFDLEATPESRGLVWYNEEWVNPEERGLVQYQGRWMPARQKIELEQRAKGLVYDAQEDRWMSPRELQDLIAVRMKAQGKTLYQGRYLTDDELKAAKSINEEVRRLLESGESFPLITDPIGKIVDAVTTAQLTVENILRSPIEVLLSGPESLRTRIEGGGGGRVSLTLPAGRYQLVIREIGRPDAAVGVDVLRLDKKTGWVTVYRGNPEQVGL